MSLESQAARHGVRKAYFRVKLSCGHWVKTRDEPFSERTKYGCTAGLSCGYQLDWLEVTRLDGSNKGINNHAQQQEL